MYENRSLSVQDASNTTVDRQGVSPVMLRRKNSLKAQKNGEDVFKEENRKTEPVMKQQSLDPHTVHAVTPKRTSTVFGKCCKFLYCILQKIHYFPQILSSTGAQNQCILVMILFNRVFM